MSLDVRKLEKVRDLPNGVVQARCPACAEAGSDRSGEHLRVYADGRFGCCVHPRDRLHRKRIFALVGDTAPRRLIVRVAKFVQPRPPLSVAASLKTDFRTLRTPISLSSAYAREEKSKSSSTKDWNEPVLSVLNGEEHLPYLLPDGTLVIPTRSPERYHWWKGGQSVEDTRAECLREQRRKG